MLKEKQFSCQGRLAKIYIKRKTMWKIINNRLTLKYYQNYKICGFVVGICCRINLLYRLSYTLSAIHLLNYSRFLSI